MRGIVSNYIQTTYKVKSKLIDIKSQFQKITIVDTYDFGRCLYLDDEIQLSEADEYIYHESIVHPAMLLINKPENVLIIGGGDGGALREVLKHSTISNVHLVEIDKAVIDICDRYLPNINNKSFSDSRVRVFIEDGGKFLSSRNYSYDLIIFDITDPHLSNISRLLWTKRTLESLQQKISDNKVFVTIAPSPDFYKEEFSYYYHLLKKHFNEVLCFFVWIPIFLLNLPFFICSQQRLFPDTTYSRGLQGIETKFLTEDYLLRLFVNPKNVKALLMETNKFDINKKDIIIKGN